jgi:hypothetical protein
MTAPSPIELARAAAAEHLRGQGYLQEADIVAGGNGDDFAEVRIALSLYKIMASNRGGPPVKRLGRRLVGEEC